MTLIAYLDNLEDALFLMFSKRIKYLTIFRNGVWGIEKIISIGVKNLLFLLFSEVLCDFIEQRTQLPDCYTSDFNELYSNL